MPHRLWFLFILLLTIVVHSLQENCNTTDSDYVEDYYYDHEHIDGLHENGDPSLDKVQINTTEGSTVLEVQRDKEETTTKKTLARYEVTELVIDVPDTSPKRVPIFTNFTISKPLNLAGVASTKLNNENTNIKDEGDEIFNSIFGSDKPIVKTNKPDKDIIDRKIDRTKEKESTFFNFHNYEEIDVEKEYVDPEFDTEPKLEGFKDYFHNLRKGVITGFKSVIEKHSDDVHDTLHKIVHGPLLFLSKLHKKSSDFAKKFHTAISRPEIHDKHGVYEYDY